MASVWFKLNAFELPTSVQGDPFIGPVLAQWLSENKDNIATKFADIEYLTQNDEKLVLLFLALFLSC